MDFLTGLWRKWCYNGSLYWEQWEEKGGREIILRAKVRSALGWSEWQLFSTRWAHDGHTLGVRDWGMLATPLCSLTSSSVQLAVWLRWSPKSLPALQFSFICKDTSINELFPLKKKKASWAKGLGEILYFPVLNCRGRQRGGGLCILRWNQVWASGQKRLHHLGLGRGDWSYGCVHLSY